MEIEMPKLGVMQKYSFEKNKAVILLHHDKHDRAITMKRLVFLIVCWKGRHRETARQLKAEYEDFLKLSPQQQNLEIEKAKRFIQNQFVNLEVTIP